MNKSLIAVVSLAILAIAIYTQITIFVVQPIGAVPTGKTLVMLRMSNTNFVDSADAICERKMEGVSLFCRGAAMAAVVNNGEILFRLPYSESLFEISKLGKE